MDLSNIFKAYDVRGLSPQQLDEPAAERIGAAFARFAGANRVAVGRDCRLSSPGLSAAVIRGITSQGVDAVDLGLITTDMLYYAAGALDMPGIVITASHNPPEYNGLKFCREGAAPVGADSGLGDIRAFAETGLDPAAVLGSISELDVGTDYVSHVVGVVGADAIGPLRVAADGGNGMAGVALPAVFDRLAASLDALYLEPDGTFPNHPADPLQPENLRDLLDLVERTSPDLGVAFDGDADRAFFVDEHGVPLSGSTTTAIVAEWFLERHPGATVVHNLICSRAVPEIVTRAGGTPVRTRVGHSFIKEIMKDTGAVFGGEHSGHYYFRDNFHADSGILAMLVLLRVLSERQVPLSELRVTYEPYAQSGEINLRVSSPHDVLESVAAAYPEVDRLDGLTVDLGAGTWFNLRPSNTEPVLRLNVEAHDADEVSKTVAAVRASVEAAS
ncbi:MAG TPA: phosphomannomutase/phosphoglucomutase [Acidimicrobiia bacterium]|jgi:phosphomannomutase|nr:phosphomannomutase/phosphoglucomutase [Acidimicrobiia bacterium]